MGRSRPVAVLACLVGAGLAVFAASRVWAVQRTARAGLSALVTDRTGGDLLGWLPAVALVGLAGAGALLATRGALRRGIGVLLVLAGLGTAVGGTYGVTLASRALWPALTALGGLFCLCGGVLAVRHGHEWPVMGARYERGTEPQRGAEPTRRAWDALDRGDDPTDS